MSQHKLVFVLRKGPLILANEKALLSGESKWCPAEVLSETKGQFHVKYCIPDGSIDEESNIAPDRIQPFIPGNTFWESNPEFETDASVQAALSLIHRQPKGESSIGVITEGLSKEKREFLQNLYSFMDSIGQPIIKTPFLGYQELDLYHLYQIVTQKGGMDEVTRKQEWKSVYQELGIPTMSTSASYNTRTNYKKYLYLYELKYFTPTVEKLLDDDKLVNFAYAIGTYVKIESSAGQIYYAQVVKRRHQVLNLYYIHYNGWSTSHDEWMPEGILLPLNSEESMDPRKLINPVPSRSSKSNYLISDPHYTGALPLVSGYSSGKSSGQRTFSTSSRDSESPSDHEPERESQGKKKVKRKSAPKSFVYPEFDGRDETGYSTDGSSELVQGGRMKQISPKRTLAPIPSATTSMARAAIKREESNMPISKERQSRHRITRNNLHLNAMLIDTPIETYAYLDEVYPHEKEEQDIKNTIERIGALREEIEKHQNAQKRHYHLPTNGHESEMRD